MRHNITSIDTVPYQKELISSAIPFLLNLNQPTKPVPERRKKGKKKRNPPQKASEKSSGKKEKRRKEKEGGVQKGGSCSFLSVSAACSGI